MTTWPNGHIILLEGDGLPTKLGRCDCGGMSASNPSHRLGPETDSLRAGRMSVGRDPDTGLTVDDLEAKINQLALWYHNASGLQRKAYADEMDRLNAIMGELEDRNALLRVG